MAAVGPEVDVDGALEPQDPTRASLERGLGTQYRILRLLGRGGMGAVYLARDEALERLVAIKVLATELAPTADGRERFRREARTAAQLSHPNIVPLLAFGEVDGLMYLVLGYVRGEPLSARLKRDGRLDEGEVRHVVADVAEALDYAHRKGVVHRDVKPDNILVEDETGRAVLTDFGIAKALAGGQTVTRIGNIVGTPHYMSPEQASGEEALDGRSDIYSLGIAAYAMLSGRLPFEGGTPQDALVKRLTAEAPPLAEIAPDVPDDLAAAVTRCLRRDPAARWPDARSLREAVSPSALEADQLPEPLDTLDGQGVFLLPFGLALLGVFLSMLTTGQPGGMRPLAIALLGGFILMQLPMLWSAVRAARMRGFVWRQIWGALWRQPEWWVCLWYPRRFRRSGDVWDRLPRPIRAWRIIVTAMVADLVLVLYVATVLVRFVPDRELVVVKALGRPALTALRAVDAVLDVSRVPQALAVTFVLLCSALAVTAVFCARFMRRQGFDTYTLRRVSHTLITGSTAQRGRWKNPDVAKVLLPAPAARRRSEPRTARDVVAAIAHTARGLPTEARAAVEAAAAAARGLAESADAQDAAIGRLSRNADPAECARLRERLAALQESNDPESGPMGELLTRQLALLDEMTARLAAAQSARDGLLAALKGLWRAVDEFSCGPADAQAVQRLAAAIVEASAPPSRPADSTTGEATATKARVRLT